MTIASLNIANEKPRFQQLIYAILQNICIRMYRHATKLINIGQGKSDLLAPRSKHSAAEDNKWIFVFLSIFLSANWLNLYLKFCIGSIYMNITWIRPNPRFRSSRIDANFFRHDLGWFFLGLTYHLKRKCLIFLKEKTALLNNNEYFSVHIYALCNIYNKNNCVKI